jgi:hypothetical protein
MNMRKEGKRWKTLVEINNKHITMKPPDLKTQANLDKGMNTNAHDVGTPEACSGSSP